DPDTPLVYLIAGESSGDNLGAGLIDDIRALNPDARFAGIGGPAMQAKGLNSLFPMSDLSVMGVAEIIPRLGLLLRRIRQTASHVREIHPDVVVTIDSPDFSFRVARRIKGQGIALVHYVAPTVWAWRPKRAAKIARLYDHLLTLFPFEPPYFEREGLASTFVGHPVVHGKIGGGDGGKFRALHTIGTDAPVLCMLPGSRRSEISRLLPVFREALDRLRRQIPVLHCVLPTVPHMERDVRHMLEGINDITIVVDPEQKADAFAASNAALAASGTVALELAMAGVPGVIGYRMNAATAVLARRLIRIPYVSLVNILCDKEVMPERLQERCTPDELYTELLPLLSGDKRRELQLQAFRQVRELLTPPSHAHTAAHQVLHAIRERPKV
ncbi:MAG: lipid-A-disaccharide synthase, partial [Rhodospirillaceae bacterium]|nr:lipid-A-disaccharide synthase [Rhodospirillaceae bacterium]